MQSHLETQAWWPSDEQPTSYANMRILKGPGTNPQGTSAGSRSSMMVTSAGAWPFSGTAACVVPAVNACTCPLLQEAAAWELLKCLHLPQPTAQAQPGADWNMGATGSQSCTSTTKAGCCIVKGQEQVQAAGVATQAQHSWGRLLQCHVWVCAMATQAELSYSRPYLQGPAAPALLPRLAARQGCGVSWNPRKACWALCSGCWPRCPGWVSGGAGGGRTPKCPWGCPRSCQCLWGRC